MHVVVHGVGKIMFLSLLLRTQHHIYAFGYILPRNSLVAMSIWFFIIPLSHFYMSVVPGEASNIYNRTYNRKQKTSGWHSLAACIFGRMHHLMEIPS